MNKKGKQALTLVVVSLLGLLLLSLSASADPGVLYAAPNSAGSGNCASWENACTLQTALTGASSGDEIWVMAGTYKPAAGTDRTATFQLKDGVAVYGGFAGGETAREQRDPATNPTILSGDIDNNDSQTPVITDLTTVTGNTTNSYHVLKGAAGSTLDGFTITAGYANGSSPDNNGGGLHNTSTNLMLANVIFSGNSVNNNGGGIYNDGTLAVSNGTFSGNFATIYGASAGGAVYNYLYGTLTITNCTLLGNSATYGGGLSNQGTLTMTNSTLSSNRADWGSGINNYGTLTLTNSTLSGNLAASGFSLYNHLTLNYANTIIANSTAGDCAQYGTLGTNTNNLVEDGSCSAALSGDPNLGPLVDNGGLTWTLALLPGSSAVDAGNDILCPASDQRGVSRPQRAQCDIGAYEYDYTGIYYTKPAASGIGDCQSWANACSLLTALANTLTGDEIWAAAGTYKPTEGTDRTATFQLKNGVPVYGGFAGTETARDQRDWAANLTVLSGDIDQNDLTDPTGVVTSTAHITGTNSYHVVTSSGVTETAVLDGFVITAGWANGARPDDYGGGMLNSDYSSPMLTNVTFRGNLAVYGGGMLNLDYSSPMLTNVTFSSNRANYGGGMNNINSSPTLINVTFSSNLTYEGGGMYNTNSSPTLTNVTFDGNSAGEGAGAMYNYSNS
ncbi:MAG: choice-of-anchor Q domain-containing protein, partial [Anaerolineae bacterium]|nr:choice-of-anchor Q domain-containing protein [Anaerolineae bacterium]